MFFPLRSREDCFAALMDILLKSLPPLCGSTKHLALTANVTTLGLMMARKLFTYPGKKLCLVL